MYSSVLVSPPKTTSYKGETMISRAGLYKDVILCTNGDRIDKVLALSTLWNNVALPAILYGVEAVPVSEHTNSYS